MHAYLKLSCATLPVNVLSAAMVVVPPKAIEPLTMEKHSLDSANAFGMQSCVAATSARHQSARAMSTARRKRREKRAILLMINGHGHFNCPHQNLAESGQIGMEDATMVPVPSSKIGREGEMGIEDETPPQTTTCVTYKYTMEFLYGPKTKF